MNARLEYDFIKALSPFGCRPGGISLSPPGLNETLFMLVNFILNQMKQVVWIAILMFGLCRAA
jgi:hypothetical protein